MALQRSCRKKTEKIAMLSFFFQGKKVGKKAMQNDLPNFQEDVPTRKCFCIACTNTWNSHCQLQTEEPFSNHSQMSHEPMKIESVYIKLSWNNKKRIDANSKPGLISFNHGDVLTVIIKFWRGSQPLLSFHNVHCLLITILCKKITFKIWKLWILASEAYYLGQDTFIVWST